MWQMIKWLWARCVLWRITARRASSRFCTASSARRAAKSRSLSALSCTRTISSRRMQSTVPRGAYQARGESRRKGWSIFQAVRLRTRVRAARARTHRLA